MSYECRVYLSYKHPYFAKAQDVTSRRNWREQTLECLNLHIKIIYRDRLSPGGTLYGRGATPSGRYSIFSALLAVWNVETLPAEKKCGIDSRSIYLCLST